MENVRAPGTPMQSLTIDDVQILFSKCGHCGSVPTEADLTQLAKEVREAYRCAICKNHPHMIARARHNELIDAYNPTPRLQWYAADRRSLEDMVFLWGTAVSPEDWDGRGKTLNEITVHATCFLKAMGMDKLPLAK